MQEEYFDFENFLNDKIKARGLSLEKVAEITGISISNLEYLIRGDYDHLPPAPYLRGYLIKLSDLLDFDPELWWERFQAMRVLKSSGSEDKLPENRFAKKKNRTPIFVSIAVLLLLGYIGFRAPKIFGRPILVVDYPGEAILPVKESPITIRGKVENANQLLINEESVRIQDDGSWAEEFPLQAGLNTIHIKAKKFLGREADLTRQVIYEPPVQAPPAQEPTPAPSESSATEPI